MLIARHPDDHLGTTADPLQPLSHLVPQALVEPLGHEDQLPLTFGVFEPLGDGLPIPAQFAAVNCFDCPRV